MGRINQVNLMGNLATDPILKTVGKNQTPMCWITIAIQEEWASRQNKAFYRNTNYVPVQVWGAQAIFVDEYFSRGDNIFVTGYFTSSQWEDRDTGKALRRCYVTCKRVSFGTTSRTPKIAAMQGEDEPFDPNDLPQPPEWGPDGKKRAPVWE